MKTKRSLLGAALAVLSIFTAQARQEVDPPAARNKVQIALLLDTSNSMDGLIDQTKT